MRGIMEKNKKTIADRRKRTMTGMAMSNGLATMNGGDNVQTFGTKYG